MLNAFLRVLADVGYLVPLRIKKFKDRNPEQHVLIASATKAQKKQANAEIQYELGWVTSRRGMLILTEEKLICGSWEIPLEIITNAKILHFKTLFILDGLVLKIETPQSHFQFGLQYDPAWWQQSVMEVFLEKGSLPYSMASIIIRIVLLTWVIWSLIDRFF